MYMDAVWHMYVHTTLAIRKYFEQELHLFDVGVYYSTIIICIGYACAVALPSGNKVCTCTSMLSDTYTYVNSYQTTLWAGAELIWCWSSTITICLGYACAVALPSCRPAHVHGRCLTHVRTYNTSYQKVLWAGAALIWCWSSTITICLDYAL